MRLQFRSPVDERGQLRSQVQALQKERDELFAEVKRLQSESQDCCEAREARWLSQQKELESRLEAMYDEIKARRAEAAAARDEVQRLNNALNASHSSSKAAEAELGKAAKCLEETSARCHFAEGNVQQLTAEIQELRASANDALRKAQRCDAAEAEMAELQQRLRRELLRRSDEITLEQKFQTAQSLAEERTQQAVRRADIAEQRANAAEKQMKSLEMRLADANTNLASSTTALQLAQAEKDRFSQDASTAKAKVAQIMEQLSDSEAQNAVLQREVEGFSDLQSKFADAISKASLKEQSCQDLTEQIAVLKAKNDAFTAESCALEEKRQAEMESLREKEQDLQQNLNRVQRDADAVAAALLAAEQRVGPLEAEASRCREEANEAVLEAQQRRLEAEATRMAHYEQEREVQQLRERVITQGEELTRLQTLLAMGGNADDVAAMSATSPYIGPRRVQQMLARMEDLTPRGTRPQLPPAGKRLPTPLATRPSTPHESTFPQARRSFSKSSRTPSASTRVPDDDNRF